MRIRIEGRGNPRYWVRISGDEMEVVVDADELVAHYFYEEEKKRVKPTQTSQT